MIIYDNLWKLLMIPYHSLKSMTIYDNSRQHKTMHNDSWRLMTMYDDSWQFMTILTCILGWAWFILFQLGFPRLTWSHIVGLDTQIYMHTLPGISVVIVIGNKAKAISAELFQLNLTVLLCNSVIVWLI